MNLTPPQSFRAYFWNGLDPDTVRAVTWKRGVTLSALCREALRETGILDEGVTALDEWGAAGRPRDREKRD